MEMLHLLALDISGTRIRAAVFEFDQQNSPSLIRRAETLSRIRLDPPDIVIERLIQIAREVVSEQAVSAIGVAVSAPVDPQLGVIMPARALPNWKAVPLAKRIAGAFPAVPLFMQNDANLAALAEHHMGAGQKADPLLYLAIGSEIGGGAIVNGKIFIGHSGLAIEPGHMRFIHPIDGEVYRLEDLASTAAIGIWAKRRLAHETTRSLLITTGEIDGHTVGWAAQAGDTFALSVLQEAGEWFGLALVNLIHLFSPQRLVIGGSIIQLGDLFLKPARAVVQRYILDPLFLPEDLIQTAALGDDAELFGAALYAYERYTETANT